MHSEDLKSSPHACETRALSAESAFHSLQIFLKYQHVPGSDVGPEGHHVHSHILSWSSLANIRLLKRSKSYGETWPGPARMQDGTLGSSFSASRASGRQ